MLLLHLVPQLVVLALALHHFTLPALGIAVGLLQRVRQPSVAVLQRLQLRLQLLTVRHTQRSASRLNS